VLIMALANLGSGVAWGELVRYVAYELVWVALPGVLVCALCSRSDSWLLLITTGIAVGHAMEILEFLALASLGLRSWYGWLPLLVSALAAWRLLKRRRQAGRVPREGIALSLPVLGLLLALYGYVVGTVWVSELVTQPLPKPAFASGAERVWVHPSLLLHMGDTAEIKHRWPIQDLRVSGEPYFYHYFAFVHAAAASTVTGVEISVTLLRLSLLFWMLVLIWQLYTAGYELYRTRAVGVLTVAGAVIVSEWLIPGEFPGTLHNDPGHTLGLILFLPALVQIFRVISSPSVEVGRWPIIGLLLVAALGTKAVILPVLLGGLLGYALIIGVRERRLEWRSVSLVAAVVLMGLLSGIAYLQPGSVEANTQWVEPFLEIKDTSWAYQKVYPRLVGGLQGVVGHEGWVAAWLAALVSATAIGLELIRRYAVALPAVFAVLWGSKTADLRTATRWLGMVFVASAGIGYSVANWWHGQVKFLYYGHLALIMLASYGGLLLWRARHQRRVAEAALFISLLMIVQASWSSLERYARRAVYRLSDPQPAHGPLTKGLYEGLLFLRDHTPIEAVVAVNRMQFKLDSGTTTDDGYLYYSAFSERRMFYEGWDNTGSHQAYLAKTIRALKSRLDRQQALYEARRLAPDPYPERTAVLQRLFQESDPAAFAQVASANHVNYLLVDKVNGLPVQPPSEAVELVFRNPAVEIYKIFPALPQTSRGE